jgi:hypothetical protein
MIVPASGRSPMGLADRRWWQFTLLQILLVMAGIALFCTLVPTVPFFAVTSLGFVLFAVLAFPRDKQRRPPFLRFIVLLALLLPLELAAALLAFHTLSEIDSGLWRLAVTLNLFFFIAYWLNARQLPWMGVICFALVLIPYQMLLGCQWVLIRRESQRIVAFVEAEEETTGQFPTDLTGYRFSYPRLAGRIHYTRLRQPGSFQVTYYVGTPSTSHWYTPEGGWGYYPD